MRILLLMIAGLLLAISVMPLLGHLTQPFEIFSHFRVQYLALSVALAVLTLALRQWQTLSVCMLCIAFNGLAIGARLPQVATQAASQGKATKIIWANLYRQTSALQALAGLAEAQNADVLTLTELPVGGEATIRSVLPEYQCITVAQDTQNPFTVAIATKAPCLASNNALQTSDSSAVASINLSGLHVVALHARPPWNNQRTAERDRIIRTGLIRGANAESGVVLGDFNATPWSPVFRSSATRGLTRVQCGSLLEPTWRSDNPLLGLTIDHVFVTPGLVVTNCRVGPDIGSDHRPLVFSVARAR